MMQKWLGFAVTVFILIGLSNQPTLAFSLIGSETVPAGKHGLRVGMGYPSVYAAYHIPLKPDLEIAPKFTFFYGWDTDTVIGNKIGAEVKLKLWEKDKFGLGLIFDSALVVAYDPDLAVGLQVGGPGVILSYTDETTHASSYTLICGMKVPFGFLFFPDVPDYASDFWASIPILFVFGGEYSLSENLNLFGQLELGPDVIAASGQDRPPIWNERSGPDGSHVEFSPHFHFGISYLF